MPQAAHFIPPSLAPSNNRAKKLWFCWFLGWVDRSCLRGWVRPPRDQGMLGSPALPWLAESWDQAPTEGTHRCSPFLSCLQGLQQSSRCLHFNHSTRKKKKKKMEKATGATARSKYQCYHLSLAAAAFRAVAGVLCFVRYLQHGGTQRKGRSEATVRGGGWEHQLGPRVLA